MAASLQPAGNTCTTVEERQEYARLPPLAIGYLTEKVKVALKAPRIGTLKLPSGSTTTTLLKQIVATAAIRVDETIADFHWLYKAEVSFDMSAARRNARAAPVPFLSSNRAQGPGRRHSLNPFPSGFTTGNLRRPDVIIVKNVADRWPGRGTQDHDGASHVDNLLRLVEIKFPGDDFSGNQERDYVLIAGGVNRMSVLDVTDCDGDLEWARRHALAPVPALLPKEEKKGAPLRAPIRTQQPIAQPAWYEDWIPDFSHARHEIAEAVASLWDDAKRGAQHLSAEASAWLHKEAPWLFTAGHWVADASHRTWAWVNEQGQVVVRYTAAQFKAGWDAIVRQTDLTWEMLRKIDWGQVGMSMVKGLAVLVLVVAGVVLVLVLAEALVAVLAALVAIVAAASAATLATLAAALGVTAVAAAG